MCNCHESCGLSCSAETTYHELDDGDSEVLILHSVEPNHGMLHFGVKLFPREVFLELHVLLDSEGLGVLLQAFEQHLVLLGATGADDHLQIRSQDRTKTTSRYLASSSSTRFNTASCSRWFFSGRNCPSETIRRRL
jgi:hypothetical protein